MIIVVLFSRIRTMIVGEEGMIAYPWSSLVEGGEGSYLPKW